MTTTPLEDHDAVDLADAPAPRVAGIGLLARLWEALAAAVLAVGGHAVVRAVRGSVVSPRTHIRQLANVGAAAMHPPAGMTARESVDHVLETGDLP